jgi:transcriptional regulator with XRE-family HTH domain
MAINKLRKRLCTTQADYAELMSMDRSHFSHSEKGKRGISRIATALQSTLENLLEKKDSQIARRPTPELSPKETENISNLLINEYYRACYRIMKYKQQLSGMKKRYVEIEPAISDLEWLLEDPFMTNIEKSEWVVEQIKKLREKSKRANPENQMLIEIQIASWEGVKTKSKELLEQWVAEHDDSGVGAKALKVMR